MPRKNGFESQQTRSLHFEVNRNREPLAAAAGALLFALATVTLVAKRNRRRPRKR